MKITYTRQPKNSRQCGQYCLMMVTGKSIEEIIDTVGTKKGTTTKRILHALDQFGIKHSGRLITRGTKPLPKIAICKVRREWSKTSGWHWVLLYDGMIYDPDPSGDANSQGMLSVEAFDEAMMKVGQKISSYIRIDM